MEERDMMYGSYCQGVPGNIVYGNFGYQGMPGSLMSNGMMNNYYPNNSSGNYTNGYSDNTNIIIELSSRTSNLENRVKLLEQRLGNNSIQDDDSIYMI